MMFCMGEKASSLALNEGRRLGLFQDTVPEEYVWN